MPYKSRHNITRRSYHFVKAKEEAPRRSAAHVLIIRVNIARPICNMMFGENHHPLHRFGVGVVVAGAGVVMAKTFGHGYGTAIGFLADGVGFGLHALGITPFLEWIIKKHK